MDKMSPHRNGKTLNFLKMLQNLLIVLFLSLRAKQLVTIGGKDNTQDSTENKY